MVYYLLTSFQLIFALFVLYLIVRVVLQSKNITTDLAQHNSVSIIIPFCNESQNLFSLLESLSKQDYKGLYEIILVNDQSTDNFIHPITAFKESYPDIQLKVIDSLFDETIHLTSKQQAIDTGVQQAAYNWIAFTDADMLFEKNWLSSLMNSTGNHHHIVFGHTIVMKKGISLFEMLQAFQLEFLFATAYALHSAKLGGSCMGNNLLISKKAYQEIGGQSGLGYSITEDLSLLNAALKKGLTATPVIPFVPTAQTQPCKTAGQFFHQALRWLKGGLTNSFSLSLILLLLGCQNIIFLLSAIKIFPILLLWISISNFILLNIFVLIVFKKIGSKENIFLFPIYYIVMIFETVIMTLPAFTLSPVWKKRKI